MGRRLNDEQRVAVGHEEGPMMVLAGPGSGKTTVILCRLRRLLEEGKAAGENILVVTFTKAAAEEMKRRFPLKNAGVTFATFHSIFFRILRKEMNYRVDQIILEEERRNVFRSFLSKTDWQIQDHEEYISQFLQELSFMHNEQLSYGGFEPRNMPKDEFRKLYQTYERYKENNHKLDFDDMMTSCFELLQTNQRVLAEWRERFTYIMVDEFQDINKVQYACLRLLAAPRENLFVVGDDDQSIYSFRGARPDFLLEFSKHFPNSKQAILNKNYRSTDHIIGLAKRLIEKNQYRFKKNQAGVQERAGCPITLLLAQDLTEEAEEIAVEIGKRLDDEVPAEEIAVIYRTNLQAGAFARALHRRGIPYVLKDGGSSIYDHWIVKDLLAYLHLAESEDSDSALLRIINKPKRYISKELLGDAGKMRYTLLRNLYACPTLKKWQEEQLENLQQDLQQLRKRKPYEALRYIRNVIGYDEYLTEYATYRHSSAQMLLQIADEIVELATRCPSTAAFERELEELSTQMKEQKRKRQDQTGVMLMTMHGAKGLEFESVFLPTVLQGIIPHDKSLEEDQLEEERRLFYVAITRAKEQLILSMPKERYGKDAVPSVFLEELGMVKTAKKSL